MRSQAPGRVDRWTDLDLELGEQLLTAARESGPRFADVFNENFLGHRSESLANLHVLLWGVTSGVLRSGRGARHRTGEDIEQLAQLAAATADPGLFDDRRGRATLHAAQQGAAAVPELATNLATSLIDLYTVSACCIAAIDDRMRTTTIMSDSWQKRYRIHAKALRFNVGRHDRKRR